MPRMSKETFITYMRNFIFGAEDSLVSTVGLLSGIATAGVTRASIIITGIILIFVEAFSMAVGTFLAEQTTEESLSKNKVPVKTNVISGIIMLASYFVAGVIPLSPYLIESIKNPFWSSIVLALISLFILGAISAEALKTKIWHNAIRMFLIGGSAVAIGALIGQLLN